MDVPRRLLLSAVIDELRVAMGESHGVPGFRLGDLATASDEVLGSVVPVQATDRAVFLADGHVCTLDRAGGQLSLFPAQQVHLDAFNACDSSHDLAAVAALVAERWDVGPDAAFALVRDLFLRLLAAGVLVPGNPLQGRP